MKKGMQAAAGILLIAVMVTPGYADNCPDPACSEPVSKAVLEVAKNEEETFVNMTKQTIAEDKSMLEDCLSGIQGMGLGIGINLPSLEDIFNAACTALQDIINQRINQIKGKFTYTVLGGMINTSGTSGESGVKVKVTDISGKIVDKLKGPINNAIKR